MQTWRVADPHSVGSETFHGRYSRKTPAMLLPHPSPTLPVPGLAAKPMLPGEFHRQIVVGEGPSFHALRFQFGSAAAYRCTDPSGIPLYTIIGERPQCLSPI